MSNQIDAVKQFQPEIAKITSEMKLLHSEVLSVSKATREAADSLKGMKSPKGVNDAIKKANDESKKLTETVEKQRLAEIKLQKAREKAFDDYDRQIKKQKKAREQQVERESQLSQRLQKQRDAEAKAIIRATQLSDKLGRALNIATKKRNELAQVIQDLNVKRELGNKLSDKEQKELKQSTKEFQKYDTAIRNANKSVGRFQENVGNYPKGLSASTGAIRSLTSALGLAGGAFLAVGVASDAFKRIKNFDKAMQNLSGVLRVSRKDISDLEKTIISVAGKSVRTSNEIALLATSLTTLGKSKDEVKALLQPVTDLSLGLNASADEAGEFLVQMLNAFGASTDEATKYADTIATIRISTSLDFQKMRDSFAYIAPVAKVLGKDLAQVGAEVGILADNGLKAESAGRLLASSYQKLAKDGMTMADATNIINEAQSKGVKETELLAIASKLFGVQSAKVGIILANNTKLIDENAQAIRENGGALDKLVKENLKSLTDKVKVLDSSWEELILTIDNGNGSIGRFFKGGVDLASRLLRSLTLLQKAQGELNKAGVEGESGWRRFFNGVVPGLSLLESGYDKALKAQKKFIKTNEQLSKLDTETITSIYQKIKNQYLSNELSAVENKVYKKQIFLLNDLLKKRDEERKSLVKTAKELGYAGEFYDVNKKKLFNYYKTADEAGSRSLKIFIENEKAKLKASEGLTPKGKAKPKSRKEAVALSDLLTKTSNDLADTEIRNAMRVTDTQIAQYAKVNKIKQGANESDSDFKQRVEDEIRGSREITDEYRAQYIALQKLRKLANEPFDENGQILDPEQVQADVDRIVGDLKKIEDARKQLIADEVFKEALVDLSDTFDQFTDVSGAKLLRFFDALDTNGKASLEELGEIASASFSLIGDVSNSFFQEKINKYDEDIEASNSYYDNLLANEENSEEINKRITKDKEAAELRIKEKQKKEREKQFKADKAFAIAEIAVNTAVAVSKAAGQTGIFGLAASIPLIALGAVQTGIVLAQKMPKFAEGGTMQYDGAMMINDHSSGRLEVVERDGQLLMTDKRNAIVEGKKGDIIHKDAQAYFKNLSADDILNDAENHSMIATINHQNNIANKLNSKKAKDVQKIQTDRIVDAIMSKKTQFKVQNNVSLSDDLRYLNASNEF